MNSMIVTDILKARTLKKQWTYFNEKYLRGDTFPHLRYVRNEGNLQKGNKWP